MALRRTYTRTLIGHLHDCCRAGLRAARAGIALAALVSLASSAAAGGAAASDAVVAQLIVRDLIGVPGKEVTMETVEYAPGANRPRTATTPRCLCMFWRDRCGCRCKARPP